MTLTTQLAAPAWLNIARCADLRAQEKTFNWDEDQSPLGELVTREMARMLAYRCALIENVLETVRCEQTTNFL
jgi:hypothetical protein